MSSHASCVSEPVVFLVEHDRLPARLRFASGVTVLLEATDPALCAFVAALREERHRLSCDEVTGRSRASVPPGCGGE